MPRLPEDGYESDDSENLLEQGARRAKNLWSGFLDFAMQGNVLEIAFGLMYSPLPLSFLI
jgi:large conductance mechanosensitive channel